MGKLDALNRGIKNLKKTPAQVAVEREKEAVEVEPREIEVNLDTEAITGAMGGLATDAGLGKALKAHGIMLRDAMAPREREDPAPIVIPAPEVTVNAPAQSRGVVRFDIQRNREGFIESVIATPVEAV